MAIRMHDHQAVPCRACCELRTAFAPSHAWRPKVEQFGEAPFIAVRTAQMVQGRVAFGWTHLFVGRGCVVSVTYDDATPGLNGR